MLVRVQLSIRHSGYWMNSLCIYSSTWVTNVFTKSLVQCFFVKMELISAWMGLLTISPASLRTFSLWASVATSFCSRITWTWLVFSTEALPSAQERLVRRSQLHSDLLMASPLQFNTEQTIQNTNPLLWKFFVSATRRAWERHSSAMLCDSGTTMHKKRIRQFYILCQLM